MAAFRGVDPRFLREAAEDEVRRWLEAIDGIGPWSSSFILVRGLGRGATVEGMEESLLPAATKLYGAAVDRAALRRLGARYGRWQGYWAHYLRVAS